MKEKLQMKNIDSPLIKKFNRFYRMHSVFNYFYLILVLSLFWIIHDNYQGDLQETFFGITFINDIGNEIELAPHLVEVDNVPFPYEKQIKLENRDKITISIPLFMRKYIKVNEKLNFLKFKT